MDLSKISPNADYPDCAAFLVEQGFGSISLGRELSRFGIREFVKVNTVVIGQLPLALVENG